MLKIGLTGQSGFIGTHLYNFLGLQDEVERIPFEDAWFDDQKRLQDFVASCDVIVHLAALNRHNDPETIYQTNFDLVKKLIAACEATRSTPHILFSSSTQEEKDNPYGRSKKEGRELLERWADKNDAQFTALIIPNVFGPFGNPYYNSFIATFCHQLTHGEQPRIEVDAEVELIYVGELVKQIWNKIKDKSIKTKNRRDTSFKDNAEDKGKTIRDLEIYEIPYSRKIKVSETLEILERYKKYYFDKGVIPEMKDAFERDLFNTFVSYIDHKSFFPFRLEQHADERGTFVELVKLYNGGQISFSTTKPGITRGNHFHIRKAERFAVIKGKARIDIRRIGTEEVLSFELDGDHPSFVDMPVWYTHNITNTGDEELYTIFWISEFYDPKDPDTFYERV